MKYREWRLVSAGPATVNHDLTILGAMLRWGVEKKLIGSNPLDGIKKLPNDNPRDGRPLADDEVARLLETSMTMKIYAKVEAAPKRQTVARLSYAQGATPPKHVLPLASGQG